jgi:subtilase family serine protease
MGFLGVRPVRGTTTRFVQLSLAAGAALSAATITAPGAIAAAPRTAVGSVAKLPQHTRVVGALSAKRRLALTVSLQPRDPGALARYATAVSTPGNRDYGRFLSVPQFASRFGAPRSHIAAVRRTMRRDGLTIGHLDRNNLTLAVSGSTKAVEHAFEVPLFAVRVAGRRAFANSSAATLPGSIARYVQAVNGFDTVTLDNAVQPQVASHSKSDSLRRAEHANASAHVPTNGGPQPCPSATAVQMAGQGLTADSIATAYGFPALYQSGDLGQGQTIGLFEISQDIPTDPAEYFGCYGIAPTVTVTNVNGGPAATGDDGEVALDIEIVAGMAPKAAIDVYQGSPALSAAPGVYSSAISANQAKILSASLGACEQNDPVSVSSAEATLFQEAATQGQTMLASSGDQGSAACDTGQGASTALATSDPASQPFVTGVGGTTLFTQTAQGNEIYQVGTTPMQGVWNDGAPNGAPSATGGGVSTRSAMPAYQSSTPGSLSVVGPNSSAAPCAAATGVCREVPDVSADADPDTGYVVFATTTAGSPPAWTSIGGTSAASPLWAAFIALTNDLPTCRGLTIGFANPLLYSVAGASYNNNFTDITLASPVSGNANNDAVGANNGIFPVGVGYDMATGLGSMTSTLASSLCSARSPVFTVTVANPGTVPATAGKPFALQIAGTDSGAAALSYSATGLPAGLAISPTTGVISGTPTTVGTATVTVAAGDAFTNNSSTQFALAVTAPPKIKKAKPLKASKITLAGLAKRKPTLTFVIGGGKTALKAFSISVPTGLAFSKKPKLLNKGVKVKTGKKAAKFKATGKKRVLGITLKKTAKKVTVTIGRPALTITRSEAKKIKRKKVKTLALTIRTTNAKRKTHTQKVTLKKLT